MSYCVNCGVELDKTTHKCALCGTPVNNPNQPVDTESPPVFPQMKAVFPPVNRRYVASIITVILLLPNIVCTLINLLYSGGIFWAIFVIGASMVLWVITALPFLFARSMPTLLVALSGLSMLLYIFLVNLILNEPSWFISLALPIVTAVTLFSTAITAIKVHCRPGLLMLLLYCLCAAAALSLVIESFVDLYLYKRIALVWSPITVAAIFSLIILLIILIRNKPLREEVKRRIHL